MVENSGLKQEGRGAHFYGPHKDSAAPPSIAWRVLGFIGDIFFTIAAVLILFAVWQLFWTTLEVQPHINQVISTFEKQHPPNSIKVGERRTDNPPPIGNVAEGEVYGMLHVPVWDWKKVPLAQGITNEVLKNGNAGHYDQTAQPGEIGNFSVAAHRRTNGNNFRAIDKLKKGDKVVVETEKTYYVYTMDRYAIYEADDPTNVRVISPVPDDLTGTEAPTERWMTMTTCHPEWGNWERYIVHLKLESWTPKSTGVPQELIREPRP